MVFYGMEKEEYGKIKGLAKMSDDQLQTALDSMIFMYNDSNGKYDNARAGIERIVGVLYAKFPEREFTYINRAWDKISAVAAKNAQVADADTKGHFALYEEFGVTCRTKAEQVKYAEIFPTSIPENSLEAFVGKIEGEKGRDLAEWGKPDWGKNRDESNRTTGAKGLSGMIPEQVKEFEKHKDEK